MEIDRIIAELGLQSGPSSGRFPVSRAGAGRTGAASQTTSGTSGA